jgi:mRNA-degrading endonuclease RelE of RelBE toxin-antitoxin system
MELEVPDHVLKKLLALSRTDRERIKKKLDDIEYRISELNIEPQKAIEKRLRGRLHPFLQQRIGGWRLWFREDKANNLLHLVALKSKKEAEREY